MRYILCCVVVAILCIVLDLCVLLVWLFMICVTIVILCFCCLCLLGVRVFYAVFGDLIWCCNNLEFVGGSVDWLLAFGL